MRLMEGSESHIEEEVSEEESEEGSEEREEKSEESEEESESHIEEEESEDPLVSENVQHVAVPLVQHRQPMNFIVNEHFDCIIEGSVRVDVDQVLHVMQHLSPGTQSVLLQLLHLKSWRLVVHLQNPDEVGDCQHSYESLFDGVPQGGRTYSIVDKRKEGFLQQQLGVEDAQLGGGGDQVVAAVELEELHEDLVLVLLSSSDTEL